MVVGKVHLTKRYKRFRQFSPRRCAVGSFRIKTLSKRTKLVVCCPKGKYNKSRGRCHVGMKAQSILKKR